MQNRTALTVFFVRVVFVLFETHRFCYAARLVFPDLFGVNAMTGITDTDFRVFYLVLFY